MSALVFKRVHFWSILHVVQRRPEWSCEVAPLECFTDAWEYKPIAKARGLTPSGSPMLVLRP